MRKIFRFVLIVLVVYSVFAIKELWQDKRSLRENLVRLHVVANSDSEEDQKVKLQVKDAIVAYLQPIMEKVPDKDEAMQYIRENLSDLQALCNDVLTRLGVSDRAKVTLQPERFSKRIYDTFSLPSGVYDALRVQIGNGEGKNWWCVVFPSLCLPATGTDMQETAVSAGFSETLTGTIRNQNGYRLRFFLLDCMGKLENLFCK
jgi:stage II sporulation protein R